METYKRIMVMYTSDIPQGLLDYVGSDQNLNLTKDGLREFNGTRAFRCLIGMRWRNSHDDQGRLTDLMNYLDSLEATRQIIAYRKTN